MNMMWKRMKLLMKDSRMKAKGLLTTMMLSRKRKIKTKLFKMKMMRKGSKMYLNHLNFSTMITKSFKRRSNLSLIPSELLHLS